MKFRVVAIAVDLTQTPTAYSQPREEVVDSLQNSLFAECASIQDVEFRYESFWNYRDGPDVVSNPSQKIKVLSVTPILQS